MNARRPNEEGYTQGLQLFLTPERRRLIGELEAIAFDMGSVETNRRIGIAAEDGYDGHHHITQLLVRKNLKQGEFAEELICALRNGRTGAALALTRTLLEGGVELSWAADKQLRGTSEQRLLRILRRGYEAMAEVSPLPSGEQAVLTDATARGLRSSPESARNAMQEMDAAEVRAGGGAYWESHYEQFQVSSDYVHTSFLGPARFTIIDTQIHVNMNPDPIEGMAALRWGLFYFVRGADAVLRLVGLDADSQLVVARYSAITSLAADELQKVLCVSGSEPSDTASTGDARSRSEQQRVDPP
jgi:hypothetical protein